MSRPLRGLLHALSTFVQQQRSSNQGLDDSTSTVSFLMDRTGPSTPGRSSTGLASPFRRGGPAAVCSTAEPGTEPVSTLDSDLGKECPIRGSPKSPKATQSGGEPLPDRQIAPTRLPTIRRLSFAKENVMTDASPSAAPTTPNSRPGLR